MNVYGSLPRLHVTFPVGALLRLAAESCPGVEFSQQVLLLVLSFISAKRTDHRFPR